MIDIEKLRKLEQAATPGPWVRNGTLIGPGLHEIDLQGPTDQDWYSINSSRPDEDAAFISAMRDALPELLDKLEAMQKPSEATTPVALEAMLAIAIPWVEEAGRIDNSDGEYASFCTACHGQNENHTSDCPLVAWLMNMKETKSGPMEKG